MKCSVTQSDRCSAIRVIYGSLCLMLAMGVVSCSEDLPHPAPVPDDATGMDEEDQKASDDDMMSSSDGDTMRTGSPSGGAGGNGAKGGNGAAGRTNSPQAGAAGNAQAAPMSSGGMGGGMAAGSPAPKMNAAGAAGSMPAVKVVAACMARAGEMVCDGAKMIKCGEMFEAAETMPCQNEARCFAGLAAGACGKCDPGVTMCAEKDLMECSMSGEMVVKEPCATEALCDQIGKRCEPPACETDEYSCEGGSLLRCKDDLTDWEVKEPCPPELCDAEGKKCNKCLPGNVMCKSNTTLATCAPDGSEENDSQCPMATPICEKDKCVQCLTDDMCKPMSDCQKSTCMEGKCTPVQNLPIETPCSTAGGKVCSLGGSCVACNSDLSCNPSQRCSLVYGCIERRALTVSSLIPGTYTVQVNAGWGLEIVGDKGGDAVSVSAIGLSTNGGDHRVVLTGNEATQRIVTFRANNRGATGRGLSMLFPTLVTSCYASPITDTSATLQFADVNPQMDGEGNEVPGGTCGNVTVSIRAVE
jgi:hypothetical protein